MPRQGAQRLEAVAQHPVVEEAITMVGYDDQRMREESGLIDGEEAEIKQRYSCDGEQCQRGDLE